MTTAEQHDEDRLVAYVSRALEMRERGEEPQLEELCREHPELIDRVAEVLGGAQRLAKLAVSASEFDGLAGRLLEGRYRLDARLGAGSMGIVYRAFDTKLSRTVAVKVLRPELFGGRDAEQRFLREAEVLATLRHPNVVAVHDRGRTADGVSYLVMELLSGQPLIALLSEHERLAEANGAAGLDDMSFVVASVNPEGQFEQTWMRQAVRWTADLARGLGEAHRLGILHRDIKPSNVFVGKDGRARLLDFGVASSSQHATLTAGNAALGTPGYMAPEVITEQAPASPATDVYGLGATLYHLLARRAPYLGTVTNIIASVQRRDPIPVGRLRPGLQRDLHAIVDKAMARNASERYATMAEFENDLRAFSNHQPVEARPLTTVVRTWRNLRRSPSAKAVAGVLAVLGLAGAAYQWSEWRAGKRLEHHIDATKQLPPGLTLENTAFRKIVDPVEREALQRLLDQAVATSEEPLPSRLLRAGFYLDQGQAGAAASDMNAIDAALRTPVTAALAKLYAEASARGGAGHASLQMTELPEPTNPQDRYLVGYHLLRGSKTLDVSQQIISWLEDADPKWLPGQEMLAFALNHRAAELRWSDPKVAADSWARVIELISAVESRRGARTAATALQLGAALYGQQRIDEAVTVLRHGVRLCPWSNGLLRNLAQAQRDIGDRPGAVATLQRAIELRPGFLLHYAALAAVHAEHGCYAESMAAIESMPIEDDEAGQRNRLALIAGNDYLMALTQFALGDMSMASESASRAVANWVAAGQEQHRDITNCRALAKGDVGALALEFLRQWEANPSSWLANANLGYVMSLESDAFGPESISAIGLGLQKLSKLQAPSRPVAESRLFQNQADLQRPGTSK